MNFALTNSADMIHGNNEVIWHRDTPSVCAGHSTAGKHKSVGGFPDLNQPTFIYSLCSLSHILKMSIVWGGRGPKV